MNWFDLLNLDTTANEQPEWDVVSSNPNYSYADEYDKGYGGATQDAIPAGGEELFPGWTGTGMTGIINALNRAGGAQKLLGQGLDLASSRGGIAAIMALLSAMDRQRPSGGGTTMAYQGPKQYSRTVDPKGIVRYAAEGGLMHAYAHGGEAQAYAGGKPLMMEDGGFVFTEKATRKLGPKGIAALGGKMISAPGNGTNDKGVTGIIGKHGVTPARVSNKESYFPKEVVDANGGPKRMYAAMNKLQRKA